MLEECHRLVLLIVVLCLENQIITLLQHGQYTLQEALAAPVFHTRPHTKSCDCAACRKPAFG